MSYVKYKLMLIRSSNIKYDNFENKFGQKKNFENK